MTESVRDGGFAAVCADEQEPGAVCSPGIVLLGRPAVLSPRQRSPSTATGIPRSRFIFGPLEFQSEASFLPFLFRPRPGYATVSDVSEPKLSGIKRAFPIPPGSVPVPLPRRKSPSERPFLKGCIGAPGDPLRFSGQP